MTDLEKATAQVIELERDAERIGKLAEAANEDARAARSGAPSKLTEAAAKAAGLERVHGDLQTELETARAKRDELQAAADRANAQAAYQAAVEAHAAATAAAKAATLKAAATLRAAVHEVRAATATTERTAEAAMVAARKAGITSVIHAPYEPSSGYADNVQHNSWDGANRLALTLRDLVKDGALR